MTTIIIGPKTFEFMFYLFVLVMGLDFTWSGYLVIKNKTREIKKPRLLGLWILQKVHIPGSKKKEVNTYMNFVYDIRNMGVFTLASGILLIFGSTIMIIDILL